jgi:3-methylfumaryl-CoA hydratase
MAAFDDLRTWLGRTETQRDVVTAAPIHRLAATLGVDPPTGDDGDPLPMMWHLLFCATATPGHLLGSDGHPVRGGFLPPVTLRRRMYAGGRIDVAEPLRLGEEVTRRSTVGDVTEKAGRSGGLVIVTVVNEYTTPGGGRVVDEQDLVYTNAPPSRPHSSAIIPDAPLHQRVPTDEVMLFRYSALTFNGHRIHYDDHYATAVEGYPGLVVHGPLLATLLAAMATRHSGRRVARFTFRATAPLFAGDDIELRGWPGDESVELRGYGSDATEAMVATAVIG